MVELATLRRCSLPGGVAGALVLILILGQSGLSPEAKTRTCGDDVRPSATRAWPMFGGSLSRNMVNTVETHIATDWSVEEGNRRNIKWVARLGSKAYGGPVVADGKVFVGTNNENPRNPAIKGDKGIVMCFRESDGQFLWQAVHDKLEAGRVNDWPREGIISSPAVEGKRLYYVSNRCELVCADTEAFLDGKNDGAQDEKYRGRADADFIWRLDMMKELKVFPHNLAICSPLVAGDLVFAVTGNGVDEGHIHIPSPEAPSFIAVNKQTGKVVWQSNAPGDKIMHGQWSNPAYAVVDGRPQVIFPGGDGWLRGFEPATGKLIWKFDANPKNSVFKLGGRGTRSDFIATPVVHDDNLYIGVGQDPEHGEGVGHLWCIDLVKATRFGPQNKDQDVSAVNDDFDPRAEANKRSALAWHYGGPVPKELQEKVGRLYYFGRTLSTCAVHDGLVYAADLDSYLHCLDAKTGEQYWQHDMEASCWSSPYWVDGKVYMGSDDGFMHIFAHGKEKKIIAEVSMGEDARIRSGPVAANGVLYVMTNDGLLYAIANK